MQVSNDLPESLVPVPLIDLRAAYLQHKSEFDAAVARVLDSGWYLLGKELEQLESEFAEFIGRRFAVGVASGTDAIKLSLRAGNIGPGDAVYTVSHTAVGTVSAIDDAGARPVFVDIDPTSFTMDPTALEAVIRSGRDLRGTTPRAVLPVNIYGHAADLPAICEIARRYELQVIEDCAQSHGALIRNQMTGTWGESAAFSFYPTKNMGAFGDAGMVVCDDAALAIQLRSLREYGWKQRYVSHQPGYNSRLDEIQAAILRVRLRHLPDETTQRRSIAAKYNVGLQATSFTIPNVAEHASHVYHQYVIRAADRESVREKMKNEFFISTGVHYPVSVHNQPAYAEFAPTDRLPHTEAACRTVISLPMYPQLSDADVSRVIHALQLIDGAGRW